MSVENQPNNREEKVKRLKLEIITKIGVVISGLYDIEEGKSMEETIPALKEKLEELTKIVEKLD